MTDRERRSPHRILIVEDSPTDVLLAREALEQSTMPCDLEVVVDGVEALAYLRREGRYADASRPDLVLLDLNLPRKDGRAVLREIKADPSLRLIPVAVLTTSQADADVLEAYGLHANCYLVKPVDFERFAAVVRTLEEFWFSVVRLPAEARHERR